MGSFCKGRARTLRYSKLRQCKSGSKWSISDAYATSFLVSYAFYLVDLSYQAEHPSLATLLKLVSLWCCYVLLSNRSHKTLCNSTMDLSQAAFTQLLLLRILCMNHMDHRYTLLVSYSALKLHSNLKLRRLKVRSVRPLPRPDREHVYCCVPANANPTASTTVHLSNRELYLGPLHNLRPLSSLHRR